MAGNTWNVGDRVTLEGKGDGTIAFIGEPKFATGKWFGVILDQPNGKNNGTVQNVRYFECEDNHGVFVNENKVTPLGSGRLDSARASLTSSTASLLSLTSSQEEGKDATSKKMELPRPNAPNTKSSSGLPAPSKLSTLTQKAARPSLPSGLSTSPPKTSFVETQHRTNPTVKEHVVSSESTPETLTISAITELSTEPTSLQERREFIHMHTSAPAITELDKRSDIRETIDHAKMKREYDAEISKLKVQLEQLELNKSRMVEVNAELQRNLQHAEREVRELKEAANEDTITELHDTIEELTLDKEMAEELHEKTERELEELKLKHEETMLELETLQHQLKAGGTGEVATNFKVVELDRMNEQLRTALIKLRDLSADEKHRIQTLQRDLNAAENENQQHLLKIQRLVAEEVRNAEVMADLREQVEAALGAEEMVERLTDQKLNLEEKVEELQSAINDYEDMTSVNNEIIELASQKERKFLERIDMLSSEIADSKMKMSGLQQAIADSGLTLLKFRDLIRQYGEENVSLREQLQITSAQTTGPMTPVTVDFRIKIQDDKLVADRVDYKMLKITEKILEKKLDYISLFMPDLYASNREEMFIQVCLLPEKISQKVNLIAEEVAQKFEVPGIVDETLLTASSLHRRDQLVYALTFLFFINVIDIAERDIDYAISTASPEMFIVLGELESQLQRQNDSIQYFIDLLKKSMLDDSISLDYLVTSASQMENILTRLAALGANQRVSTEKLKNVLDSCSAAAKAISAMSHTLKILSAGSISEVSQWLSEFIIKSSEICDSVRKIKRPLETDNDLRSITLPNSVSNQLGSLIGEIQRVTLLCYHWYRIASRELSSQTEEKSLVDGTKLRNLLYTENDRGKFYKSTSVSPQQAMASTLEDTSDVIRGYLRQIEDGEWARNSVKLPEVPKHPLRYRAEMLKKSISDAEELKSKICSKEEEILDVKKTLRTKMEEISELQLRLNMSGRKLESVNKSVEDKNSRLLNQVTELTSRLHTLQSEYDSEVMRYKTANEHLEIENKNMEKKLEQTSKQFLSVGITPGKSASKLSSRSAAYDTDGQLDILRQVVSSLRAEVVAVKAVQVQRDLDEKLPPLRKPLTAKRNPDAERYKKLKRDLDDLKMQRSVMVSQTALDLTVSLEEREKTMRLRKKLDGEYKLKMAKIRTEMAELSTPGKHFQDYVHIAPSA